MSLKDNLCSRGTGICSNHCAVPGDPEFLKPICGMKSRLAESIQSCTALQPADHRAWFSKVASTEHNCTTCASREALTSSGQEMGPQLPHFSSPALLRLRKPATTPRQETVNSYLLKGKTFRSKRKNYATNFWQCPSDWQGPCPIS